jgi:hypothetical protein
MRLATRGWSKIMGSEIRLVDEFIFNKLNLLPANQQEREEMYGRAKQA